MFFFFKQKTAYEMRISDWSSDVCSSDLRDQQLLRVGGREQELDVLRRLLERLQQRIERRLGQHVDFVDQVDLVAAARGHVLRALDQEIGRASCRERVCQYV